MSGYHTPGPWFHAGPIGAGQYIVSEAAPIAVAYCQNTPGAAGANAFLIAAAPDLLEALKAWELWYSEDSTEFNRETAREMGLRAIAKSEGR